MLDAIVIGSGPAGTFAARGLRGKDVLVLDVGHSSDGTQALDGHLLELKRSDRDLFSELIGDNFESLQNVREEKLSAKLKAPRLAYIVRGADTLSPIKVSSFNATMSFSRGGLANAWGAGAYRYNAEDLRDFPISVSELEPYYTEVCAEIGISGCEDDLTPFFGAEPGLQPPLEISRRAAGMLARYEGDRRWFHDHRIFMGRTRLAVSTEDRPGRGKYRCENLEFFKPDIPGLYRPVLTLDEMIRMGQIRYRDQCLATSYEESAEGVKVHVTNLRDGEKEVAKAKRLILAAGTLNTARLVLQSRRDFRTELPVLDNAMTCIPLLRPSEVGRGLDQRDGALGQLNLVYDPKSGERVQATLYGTAGPLRSDNLFDLPLSLDANLIWSKYLAPAVMMALVFFPADVKKAPRLRLTRDGDLDIRGSADTAHADVERRFIRAFRRLGFLSHPALCRRPPLGSGLHYAGSLPMSGAPATYGTHPDGRLAGTQNIFVADAATFPTLPAKNHTLTIMANALRIGMELKRGLS